MESNHEEQEGHEVFYILIFMNFMVKNNL